MLVPLVFLRFHGTTINSVPVVWKLFMHLSICLSMLTLVLVGIFLISWNWYRESKNEELLWKYNSNVAVTFQHSCLLVFAWRRVVLHFSTRNNCCEFLAFYGIVLQSDIQLYFETPVCGAPLFHIKSSLKKQEIIGK